MEPPDNTKALSLICAHLRDTLNIAQVYANNRGIHGRRFALIVTTTEAALLQAKQGVEEVAAEAAR